MKKFRTAVSVIIMVIAGIVGFFIRDPAITITQGINNNSPTGIARLKSSPSVLIISSTCPTCESLAK